MDKIDFVLPWVDIIDPEWQKKKAYYMPKRTLDLDAVSDARYRDMGTLKYVLRSIEKNCPWYNRIFIITDNQTPTWLNSDFERIEIIDHKDIFLDVNDLPVFNSVAIEMNLHNINGLSEKFIYLNDDMIIWREIDPSRFFVNNLPVDFFTHGWIPRNKIFQKLRDIETVGHSLNNVFSLFNKKLYPYDIGREKLYNSSYTFKDKLINFLFDNVFRKMYWMENWHHPQPFLKSAICDFSEKFGNEMSKVSKHKFRDKSDLSQYMYRYWNLINGNFHAYKFYDGVTANINSVKSLNKLILNIGENINFVCFNDSVHLKDDEYDLVSNELEHLLQSKFPEKALFEI